MSPNPRGEYSEITSIIQSTLQSTLEPLITNLGTKMDRLELKVNHLSEDRVTRADVEKLRSELQANLVPRDSYEARHAALIQRGTDMETMFRKHEDDAKIIIQHIHERLESGKQQFEDRFHDHERKVEEKLKESQSVHLDNKERGWLRFSQVSGALAIIIALLSILLDHVRFQ